MTTYAVVQSGTFAAVTAISRTVSIPSVTAGNSIIVFTRLQSENRSFSSFTDDKSDTWVNPANAQAVPNGSNSLNGHYCLSAVGGTTVITMQFDASSAVSEGVWMEVSNLNAFQAAVNNFASATSVDIATSPSAQPAAILVGAFSSTGSRPLTAPTATGVTFTQEQNTANQVAVADGRVTATGALTVTQAVTGGSSGIVGIAMTFTETATGSSVTRTPTPGALTLTGQTPGVANSGNANVTRTPSVGALSFTGQQPLLTLTVASPGVGSMSFTGQAPSLLTNNIRVPGVAVLSFSALAPSVANTSGPVSIAPTAGSLTLSGFFPTVANSGAASVSYSGIGWTRRRRRH